MVEQVEQVEQTSIFKLVPGHIPYLKGTDKNSWAYITIKDRMPVILTGAIDSIARNYDYSSVSPNPILSELSKLKYELERDRPFSPFRGKHSEIWSMVLKELEESDENTWFTAPWLFTECCMYRKIHEAVTLIEEWEEFDVFAEQKQNGFRECTPSITKHLQQLQETQESIKSGDYSTSEILETFIHISLWGNQTDLSLFANMQQVMETKSQMKDVSEHMLVNDINPLVNRILSLNSNSCIHFVLDNSGLELLSDLCLADILVSLNPKLKIVFHCKTHPWFVSDTLLKDFEWTLDYLETSMGYSTIVNQWREWIKQGIWTLQEHEFWCSPLSFWNLAYIPFGKQLFTNSSLIIFKGDLNYRKMIGDAHWPHTTHINEAIGPLHQEITCPFVLLRTCKSDLVTGLKSGLSEEMFIKDPKWMINGKWGMIQYYSGYESQN